MPSLIKTKHDYGTSLNGAIHAHRPLSVCDALVKTCVAMMCMLRGSRVTEHISRAGRHWATHKHVEARTQPDPGRAAFEHSGPRG